MNKLLFKRAIRVVVDEWRRVVVLPVYFIRERVFMVSPAIMKMPLPL